LGVPTDHNTVDHNTDVRAHQTTATRSRATPGPATTSSPPPRTHRHPLHPHEVGGGRRGVLAVDRVEGEAEQLVLGACAVGAGDLRGVCVCVCERSVSVM